MGTKRGVGGGGYDVGTCSRVASGWSAFGRTRHTLLCTLCAVFLCTLYAANSPVIAQGWSDRLAVAEVYNSQLGVREQGGNNRGTEVEAYLASAGFGPGYAWCAAFVSWCYLQAGIDVRATAWAPAWFPESKIIYRSGKGSRQWLKADLFGLYYRKLGRIGHVGFIDTVQGDMMITVEGNTNDGGSREGDGVYKKRRSVRSVYAVSRVIR